MWNVLSNQAKSRFFFVIAYPPLIVLTLALFNNDFCVFFFFFVSVPIIPFFVTYCKKWITGEIWCKSTYCLTLCINLASVLSVLLISADRGFAVVSPVLYSTTISMERARLLIGFLWLFSILLSIPVLFGFPELRYDFCSIKSSSWDDLNASNFIYILNVTLIEFVIPLLSLVCLYFAMFRVAQKNSARAGRHIDNCDVYNITQFIPFREDNYRLRNAFVPATAESGRQGFADKQEAVATGLLALISFTICWSPYFVTMIYQQFHDVTIEIKLFINLFTFLSGIFNPYLYFYRKQSMWKLSKKLASRLLTRVRNQISCKSKCSYKSGCSCNEGFV